MGDTAIHQTNSKTSSICANNAEIIMFSLTYLFLIMQTEQVLQIIFFSVAGHLKRIATHVVCVYSTFSWRFGGVLNLLDQMQQRGKK